MVKWLKKAFNKKSLKEVSMNLEQILKAVGGLSPEDKAKLLEALQPTEDAPPAEPDTAPEQGTEQAEDVVLLDTDGESDPDGSQAEAPEPIAGDVATEEPVAPVEEVVEPAQPDAAGQIAQAVTVAMAPVLVKLQELEQKLSEAGREPQPVTDPTKQEKLNKVAGIYGG